MIFRSFEEIIQPDILGELVQEQSNPVCVKPFKTDGWSTTDSEFLSVDWCHVESPRYIIKRVRPKQDWSMQTTEDWDWRLVANWRYGLLDRLPDEIEHGIIACFEDEDGYGLLMHNFTRMMLPGGEISASNHEIVLDGMAALHAAFWQGQIFSDPRLELCPPQLLFTFTSSHGVEKKSAEISSFILEMILEGRRLLPGFIEKGLIDQVEHLLLDPSPFCTALARYPHTLVHGDFWRANLGVACEKPTRLIVLDWSRPALTVPAFDLIYYLMLSPSSEIPISVEQSILTYKERLADRLGDKLNEEWWQPQLELCYLGVYALLSCFKAYHAVHAKHDDQRGQALADLEWWSEKASSGVKRLNDSL